MRKSKVGRVVAKQINKRPDYFEDRLKVFKITTRKVARTGLGRTDKLLVTCTFLVLAIAGWFIAGVFLGVNL